MLRGPQALDSLLSPEHCETPSWWCTANSGLALITPDRYYYIYKFRGSQTMPCFPLGTVRVSHAEVSPYSERSCDDSIRRLYPDIGNLSPKVVCLEVSLSHSDI